MSDHVIAIEQLRFNWPGESSPILDIPSFNINKGERIFLKGASGSGKSTLLSLLGGVLTPQQGDVYLLGRPLHDLRAAERDRFRADHIGFIFQMFNLIPYLSVLENVILPLYFSPLRHARVIKNTTAEVEAMRLLAHLDLSGALLQRSVTELSVGQQQRVAAARALIGQPEIIIADEPTSSLDADRREAFIKLLIKECDEAGNTLLFVSHDASLERYFDHCINLDSLNHSAQVVS
ncbi:MAG: ABC transporter ATP-binding protein [Gammaproteobacteria bacterium]|nr:ABC transporter ATP-binding protein [Gammaproteobacteria bacterium]